MERDHQKRRFETAAAMVDKGEMVDALDTISLIRKMAAYGVPSGDEGALLIIEKALRGAGDKEVDVLDRLDQHADERVRSYSKEYRKAHAEQPLGPGGMHRVTRRLLSDFGQKTAQDAVPAQPTTPNVAPAPSPNPPPANTPNLAAATPGMKTTVAALRALQKKAQVMPMAMSMDPAMEQQRSALTPAIGGAALGAGIGGASGYLLNPWMQRSSKKLLGRLPAAQQAATGFTKRILSSPATKKILEEATTRTAGKAALRGALTHAGALGALGLGYGLLRNKQAQYMYAPPANWNEQRALEQAYAEQAGNPSSMAEELEAWRAQRAQAIQDAQQVPVALGPIPPAPQQLLTIPLQQQVLSAPAAAMPAVGAAPAPVLPGPAMTASFVPPGAQTPPFQIR